MTNQNHNKSIVQTARLSILSSACLAICGISTSAIAAEFGIDYLTSNSGTAYVVDEGWTGSAFAYLCIDGCYAATLNNGRWEMPANNLNLGQTYTISTQIDHTSGQILESGTVVFADNRDSGGTATEQTAARTPTPTPSPAATPTIAPTPAPTAAATTAPTPSPTLTPSNDEPSAAADNSEVNSFGLRYQSDTSGIIYRVNEDFRANYHYLCLNSDCRTATLVDGVWMRVVENLTLGQVYEIRTQIDDDSGEVADTLSITFKNEDSGPAPTATPTTIPTTMPTATATPTPAPTATSTATPSPETQTPDPTPSSDSSTAADTDSSFGLRYISSTMGAVYLLDENYRANYHYLCIDGACYTASLSDGYWELLLEGLNLGQTYEIKTQIDDTQGEVSRVKQVVFSAQDNDSSGGSSAGGNNNETPNPEPTPNDTDDVADDAADDAPQDYTQTLYGDAPEDYSVFYDDGDKIITHVAARGRRRHEPSGVSGLDPNGNPANPNHFNYHFEYWNDRVYTLEIRDYVAYGQQLIQIELDTVGLHADNAAREEFNRPYVKCFKDFGNETNYFDSPQAVRVDGSSTRWTYDFVFYSQDLDTQPGYNYEFEADIARAQLEVGQLMECEVTIRWKAIVDAGETGEANYYGEIFRYRIGEGGLVGYNRDPNNGLTIVNDSSMIGGYMTSPIINVNESPRAYMQPSISTQFNNMENFLEGRRIMHTSFEDGAHWDPSNSSNGANPGFPELALNIPGEFEDRCSDCHIDNGNGEHTQTASGFLTPRLVGLGLLEAIPEHTIASWADPNDENEDGVSGRLSIVDDGYIGRFGYQAEQKDIRSQVLAALENEMSVDPSVLDVTVIDQMADYIRLLAVPSARSEDLDEHVGMDEFINFGCADCHKLEAQTTSHPLMELRSQTFRPFTDLLLHDLGEGEFRTTPLMGIGLSGMVRSVAKEPDWIPSGTNINGSNHFAQEDLLNNVNPDDYQLWHDGSCAGANAFDCAIRRHNGEGSASNSAYTQAPVERQTELIEFLKAI